jgi:predicted nucleotidyltransferase
MNITTSKKRLDNFCRKWKVAELSAFGSVVRDDFRPDSDVDLLVSFTSDAQWSLDDWTDMIGDCGRSSVVKLTFSPSKPCGILFVGTKS